MYTAVVKYILKIYKERILYITVLVGRQCVGLPGYWCKKTGLGNSHFWYFGWPFTSYNQVYSIQWFSKLATLARRWYGSLDILRPFVTPATSVRVCAYQKIPNVSYAPQDPRRQVPGRIAQESSRTDEYAWLLWGAKCYAHEVYTQWSRAYIFSRIIITTARAIAVRTGSRRLASTAVRRTRRASFQQLDDLPPCARATVHQPLKKTTRQVLPSR